MKKLAIIGISYLSIFCILLGIFGKSGLLVNRSLEKDYQVLLREVEEKKVNLDTLERQSELLSSSEALDDVALRLGYNKNGERVYFFTDDDNVDYLDPSGEEIIEAHDSYKGLATWIIALISLIAPIVLIIVFFITSIGKPKQDKREKEDGGDGYGDIVF